VDTDKGDDGKALTFAIPGEEYPKGEFWDWLKSSGYEAILEAEDPDRMERVRTNGVGCLTQNKQSLIDAGFATRAETVSKRPPDGTVLVPTLEARVP
jgi:hypothetical protein